MWFTADSLYKNCQRTSQYGWHFCNGEAKRKMLGSYVAHLITVAMETFLVPRMPDDLRKALLDRHPGCFDDHVEARKRWLKAIDIATTIPAASMGERNKAAEMATSSSSSAAKEEEATAVKGEQQEAETADLGIAAAVGSDAIKAPESPPKPVKQLHCIDPRSVQSIKDQVIYHATYRPALEGILTHGLIPQSADEEGEPCIYFTESPAWSDECPPEDKYDAPITLQIDLFNLLKSGVDVFYREEDTVLVCKRTVPLQYVIGPLSPAARSSSTKGRLL